MKTRPILFSAPMVRAILDGRKTQTRRAVKGLKAEANGLFSHRNVAGFFPLSFLQSEFVSTSPYGAPGDQLWVREEHYRFGHWERAGRTKTGREKWAFVADANTPVQFDAPKEFLTSRAKSSPEMPRWYKRLARFMPKVLARTQFEVVSVRVERLHSINEADAIAEGVERTSTNALLRAGGWWSDYENKERICAAARESFASLWRSINGRSINGPDSWAANPWVWRVEFKRVTP